MQQIEEFWKKIKSEAQKFRHQKMKEVFAKENPTEEEISFINQWAEMHGGEI